MRTPVLCAILAALSLAGCQRENIVSVQEERTDVPARYDVFPLAPSQTLTYRYIAEENWRSLGQYDGYSDSGVIVITITGSVQVAETEVQWTVVMRKVLRRISSFSRIWNGTEGRDTSWIDTTMTGSLREATAGRHELKGSLGFWTFPIWEYSSIDTTTAYRYADSSTVTLITTSEPFSQSGMFDTSAFTADSGLVHKSHATWNSGNSGWGYSMSADMLESYVPTRKTTAIRPSNCDFYTLD